jgi:NAD(P)-dependent dehydrogenase (short-subunit alcohol dehydrogenase family)
MAWRQLPDRIGEAMELTAGKVAVVTGAGSGIGLALAERFARAGLDIVLADVERTALEAAEQQVARLGVKTLAVPRRERRSRGAGPGGRCD